jgi:small subunit ribosomal protein S6
MYILASTVSDDQQPEVAGQIVKFVEDFGGSQIQETQLGKKKLAYPVKKTRNGFYGVVDFVMDATKINALDAKIHTQGTTIIRYIMVNMDEHYERLAKDREIQAKMNHNRPAEMIEKDKELGGATNVPAVAKAEKPVAAAVAPTPAPELSEAELDIEIEKALTEDVTK